MFPRSLTVLAVLSACVSAVGHAHAANSVSVLQFGGQNSSSTVQVGSTSNTATALQFGSVNGASALQIGLPSPATVNTSTIGQGGGINTAIAGQARALLDWHARHGFCPNCGHTTESKDGGYRRLCPACGAEHFPRTDPVVIMLPTFGGECLVGRNARFVNGLFSAFAGFVEPGESLEEAVRRELREEVAVTVGAVRYHRSQPWPFPSSLMLGCYAEALSKDFAIDGSEIAEARWISKDQARRWLKEEMMDGMRIPATIAIAHHLVKDWVEERRAEGA